MHASDEPKASFKFFLIRSRVINAFSVPGAYVGVNSGLILTARNEDELAAVLAHEIAHVTQHHIARLLAAQQRLSLPSMGAMLAGIVLAAAQPMAGLAMLTTTSAAVAQNQLDYSRRFEAEADRVGQATLVRAGFNPRAMPDFFERLERWSHLNDAGALPPFLQTHPVTAERIAQSRDRAAAYPNTPMKDGLRFELMRARLRVETARNVHGVATRYRRALPHATGVHQQADAYGLALAELRLGHLRRARRDAQALITAHPARLGYALLLAETDEAAGKYQDAARRYHRAMMRHPGSVAAEEH
ncbi:MAG TPA: M48 family metalloprotease, partial [Acidiferrobacteraceae bacterium]|nr:M48 family metalloprotease [Acidiferrobacteraceae bacterium]